MSACQNSVKQSSSGLKKIDFILDWTPNTNHTGLYVAKEKGYFKEAGLDVDIKLPPEDSSSDLIINGKLHLVFISKILWPRNWIKVRVLPLLQLSSNTIRQELFQEKMQRSQVQKDLVGKKYGTWNDPIELEMIKSMMKKRGLILIK